MRLKASDKSRESPLYTNKPLIAAVNGPVLGVAFPMLWGLVFDILPKETFMEKVMEKAYFLANEMPANGIQEYKKLRRKYFDDEMQRFHKMEDELLRRLIVSPEAAAIAMKFMQRKRKQKRTSKSKL